MVNLMIKKISGNIVDVFNQNIFPGTVKIKNDKIKAEKAEFRNSLSNLKYIGS